ncbi:redoxin domain-containing protein, partial [Sphingomonas sp. Mn802worker]|uniref:redoxin domain-containing protein n=1 Tax=Sphingomonas sp. Mn802worker TaxID=629773 RepID=UPI000563A661
MSSASYPPLSIGEPAPWFTAPMLGQEAGADFDKAGGRHVLLLLFGTAAHPACEVALEVLQRHASMFADGRAAMLGVTIDPHDAQHPRVQALQRAGMHIFVDADQQVSRRYGAIETTPDGLTLRPYWVLLDPALRVTGLFPLSAAQEAIATLRQQCTAPPIDVAAPALVLPHVLDASFAAELIALHARHGGVESGVMRQVGDRTVEVQNHAVKRRRDVLVEEPALQSYLREAITRRLVPMIERCFQYRPTEIERYLVSCYDARDHAHFAPHRDNTTPATAHRRLAVTINLNDDYDGGDLRFPEFGMRSYRAPRCGAIVFSCSLLHEVTRMTAGRRYATLPFLYGGAAG